MKEKLSKIAEAAGIIMCLVAMVIICIFGVIACEKSANSNCAYCSGIITDRSDFVYCRDDSRYHCNCYLRFIRESDFEEE